MKKYFVIAATMLGVIACEAASIKDIIPLPRHTVTAKGAFRLPTDGLRYRADGCEPIIDSLLNSAATPARNGQVKISKNAKITDSYILEVKPKEIRVTGRDDEGVMHGVQSLLQLIENAAATDSLIECGRIEDSPAMAYRGMHVDVSRHFRDIAFLKKQIDAMGRLKLNRMHLHMTDGAGWRMPSDSYPRLNTLAAWRPEKRWKEWTANGARYGGEYGGFYSKEELRELVAYAAARHIELIPEIEMPGHSDEVVAAYPELSCNGEGGDLCPGKEATFRFIEQVLDETMEIFPSEYIHIGGDEAGKSAWKVCPDCQRRMAEEGLTDVDQLQSYLISRVERYVNSKGRNIIGWDEILQGGLAPNATVMSWRGPEGAEQALAAGHDVIMTPGEACYLDYTQDAPFKEPESIGGYLPLAKVYAYEPPKGILGMQANLWAEYITDDSHAEYMYYPRAFAIAELAWSNPEKKDYADFKRRAEGLTRSFRQHGYNAFDIEKEYGDRPASLSEVEHLGRGAKVTYQKRYTQVYPAAGDGTLTDGIRGGWTYQDKKWQGWFSDLEVTLDLCEEKPLHYINTTFMHCPGPGVFLPDSVVISTSTDGKNFIEAGVLRSDVAPTYQKIMMKDFGLPVNVSARYINIKAIRNKDTRGCLFTDEIIVN